MIVFVGWFWDDSSLKTLFDGNGWLGNTKIFPTNEFTRFWNQQDDVFQFSFWMFFSVMILGMIYFFKRWFFRDYVPFLGVDALKTTEEREKKNGPNPSQLNPGCLCNLKPPSHLKITTGWKLRVFHPQTTEGFSYYRWSTKILLTSWQVVYVTSFHDLLDFIHPQGNWMLSISP